MSNTAPKDKALRDVGLAALCAFIREIRATAQDSGDAVARLAELLDESLLEIEEALNDLPKSTPLTIPVSGWVMDEAGSADYPYRYDIPVEGVTAADRAEITLAPSGIGTAVACGLCQTCETLAGKIRLRSVSVPAAALAAEYWIEEGKE